MKSKDMIPTVLVVAGSDPTGGAGIQADLKTLTSLGVYAAAAITCVTVQNSHGVQRIEPLPPDLVRQQMEAVLVDHRVTHIKIGMVGTPGIGRAIGEVLADFRGEVVYDPVLAATTGHDLMKDGALEEIKRHLISKTTVLTPNIPELAKLTGKNGMEKDRLQQAAQDLFTQGSMLRCIVVKGGHGRIQGNLLTDYCFFPEEEHKEIIHERVGSQNTHGTGCTLASAFCAYHVETGSYEKSFTKSIKYIDRLLKKSAQYRIIENLNGHGPLLHALQQSR